jgi:hypothetical protein
VLQRQAILLVISRVRTQSTPPQREIDQLLERHSMRFSGIQQFHLRVIFTLGHYKLQPHTAVLA